MKTILMVVILQAVAPGQGESAPTAQVMSSLAAEFDSKEACLNAAKGMTQLGGGRRVFGRVGLRAEGHG